MGFKSELEGISGDVGLRAFGASRLLSLDQGAGLPGCIGARLLGSEICGYGVRSPTVRSTAKTWWGVQRLAEHA